MLTRLHVDNWRSFVNFTVELGSGVVLLLGDNGSGKTGIFDVLRLLKGLLLARRPLAELLPASSRTRWDARERQRFELDLAGNGGTYRYTLIVAHDTHPLTGNTIQIVSESLFHDDRVVARFEDGKLNVHTDGGAPNASFLADPTSSPIGNIFTGPINAKLTWFKRRLAAIHTLHIDPRHIDPWSDASAAHPDDDLQNFAAWFRGLQQRNFRTVASTFVALKDIIPGFEELGIDSDLHERGRLRVRCGPSGGLPATSFDFAELSDGQRALIALYTIRYALIGPDTTVCLDEPDNFIALRELQPWLFSVLDETLTSRGAQALLISHNAELIDRLAHDHGVWFFREHGGPTRVRPFAEIMEGPQAPSSQIAEGVEP